MEDELENWDDCPHDLCKRKQHKHTRGPDYLAFILPLESANPSQWRNCTHFRLWIMVTMKQPEIKVLVIQ